MRDPVAERQKRNILTGAHVWVNLFVLGKYSARLVFQFFQRAVLMRGDMVRFITRDFVLRLILGGVPRAALELEVLGVRLSDFSWDPARFRIPRDVVSDFEVF